MCEDLLVCLFGYGSILWRPGFPYVRKFNAYIKGYKRMFYQGSTDHRGTPEAPGRVVTLIQKPKDYIEDDWITWGTVYCIPDEEAEIILKNLDYREKGGYERIETDVYVNGKDTPHGKALLYLASNDNNEYLGADTIDNIALQIFKSVGPSGRNLDYLLKLAASLRKMEVVDDHVFDLESKVLELMKLHNISHSHEGHVASRLLADNGAQTNNASHDDSSTSGDETAISAITLSAAQDIAAETLMLQKKYFTEPKGSIVIDSGAVQAISQRAKSLLAIGIIRVVGSFECDSLISILDTNNQEISRGITNYSSEEISKLIGTHSGKINQVLGFTRGEEIVENKNLILINFDRKSIMIEKKQILYVLLFSFMAVIAFQIYVTTNSTDNQSCPQLHEVLEQQKHYQSKIEESLRDVNRKLSNIGSSGSATGNGLVVNDGMPKKKDYMAPEDYEDIAQELLARQKQSRANIPNTCFPLDGKTLCLPNFIIIGAMKAGTTFLDYYIQRHPLVAKHTKKEIWYFNSFYNSKGIEFYADHFETLTAEQPKLIGEATPFYVNNPFTAARMFATLRNVKMIMMLRDPVDRVFSQYHFSLQWISKNRESAPKITDPADFETMVREEIDVIETCVRGQEKFKEQQEEFKKSNRPADEFDLQNPFYINHAYKNWTFYKDCAKCDKCFQTGGIMHTSGHPSFGMIAKSLYYEQLYHWLSYFPMDQFLFIRYEDIQSYPEKVLRDLEIFLGLPAFDYGEFTPKNAGSHTQMNPETRQLLVDYFKPHNEKLFKLLNKDFNWST
ncbi:sulfotransferase [Heterostelium album PN500]|uniref:glutathione-specific gamma-glutamylcyclotransferase n=1 Tax=Heterostelium pallidum (strain ATCC 26659 / Pp 5 / PN500) TaxID=670386 RepID=D3B6G6_HETP5|nr:sulfotransferase [Heterostelium album PN500]EFA82936.1 sulfotransferase [Heterostelium album PN500]|eukprot:XP_020435053.1 sulfotransferase [Heterostelium album PN500]